MNTRSRQANQDSPADQRKYGEVANLPVVQERTTPPIGHMDQRFHPLLLQQMRNRTKFIALAIAMGGSPLLATGAIAGDRTNQSISKEISQAQRTRVSTPADQVSRPLVEHRDIQSQKIDPPERLLTDMPRKTANHWPYLDGKGILVAETTTSAPQGKSLLDLVIRTGLTISVIGAIAAFLAEWVINPSLNLNNKVRKPDGVPLDPGIDRNGEDELVTLGSQINLIAEKLQVLTREQAEQSRRQEAEANQAQMFTDISLRIRRSLNFEEILSTAVKQIRTALRADRVVICRFDADGEGTVIAESVIPGWTSTLNEKVNDPYLKEKDEEENEKVLVRVINNFLEVDLSQEHIQAWNQFEVKADLLTRIMKDNELFGFLIAHECKAPRTWQQPEIDLFRQLAIQIGFALDQANLLELVEKARQAEAIVSTQQRQQKEALQYSLIKLLADVEEAARGNLSVRAEVTEGEIGTVADFFNSVVESLRQIVLRVKTAATQVNLELGEKEGALQLLADQAFQQAQEITYTLDSVEQMTQSIQAVADHARQAASVARTASTTASTGGAAIALTFESILNLRNTVAETTKKMKRLGEASQEISKVVSLINQIALQTNVLSINASVEAARAGQEGRGFAAVATEIGQLAMQASVATKQIEQIVENIQLETNEVVSAMELGTVQVVEGTHLVADAQLSLEQIVEVSGQIDTLVQSISTATVSQVETAQAVANLMKEIAQVSSQTSDSSRQVSSSLKQTVEVARQLQASVGVFQVDMKN